ncbi:MAG: hypothetical protein KY446_11720, partial [Proteobacteria bacterium]|nr:hypothetical protein [Pseudomonadota bacterium]
CDLGELYDTDLGGAWIGGCVDRKGGRMTTVPLPAGEPDLNAGVLLMDLGRLRANNFFARCNAVRREHGDALNVGDQCIINKVAEGRKVVVAPRWNILSHDLEFGQLVPQLESYGGEGVLHFSGITKPWSEWSDQRTADLWFSYAAELGIRRQSVLKRPVTINDHVLLAAKHEHEQDWEQAAKVRKKLVRTLIIQINEERAKKLEVRT